MKINAPKYKVKISFLDMQVVEYQYFINNLETPVPATF